MVVLAKQKILAIIPARGGSKGLPRKNVLPTAGKPLIAWTIETALGCDAIDRVVVSTDSKEISSLAVQYGAEAPFVRPPELATDSAAGIDVILHAIQAVPEFDIVIVLQPTSPLRTKHDIADSLKAFCESEADSCVSVCLSKVHPNWLKRINPDQFLCPYEAGELIPNRQQLEPLYSLNGAIYISRCQSLVANRSFHAGLTLAYVMPPERSLDVDTAFDHRLCELILIDRANSEDSD